MRIVQFIAVALLCAAAVAQEKPDNKQLALSLVQRAAAQTNFTDTPIALHAKVTIAGLKGKPTGTYDVVRLSPERVREELTFGTYREVRVIRGNQLFVQRNSAAQPLPANYAVQALGGVMVRPVQPQEEISQISHQKREGVASTCISLKSGRTGRTTCFSDADGTLIERASVNFRSTYSDYKPYKNKRIPGLIRTYEGKSLIAELIVTGIEEPAAEPSAFEPSASARSFGYCEDETHSRLEHQERPQYPPSARAKFQQGTVGVYAVIGADGNLHDVAVVQSAGPELDNATLYALAGWRYRPAMCGGAPIETETVITVNYELRGY